jgi:carbamoyltransferase
MRLHGRCIKPLQFTNGLSQMSQLILAIHAGPHDATAALFDDYDLKAAVQLERLTRAKGDGRTHPDACIDEVLGIAGATRRDVDVLTMTRTLLSTDYFRRMGAWRRSLELVRRARGKTRQYMTHEIRHHHSTKMDDLFDLQAFRQDSGLRKDVVMHFSNHHEAHALAPLFYSPWDDALLVTADGGGDTVNYSHRYFAGGAIKTIYGGEECLFIDKPVDSLGRAYSAATLALGFRENRHEGKLTGLAATGQPSRYAEIARHFWVTEDGRVHSSFSGYSHMRRYMRELADTTKREDLAASIQDVLEHTMLKSIRRLLAHHPSRHLGAAGGVFSNVKMNRVLAEQLELDEFFIFPAMGDEGLPVGSALIYLMERDGIARWLDQRRALGPVYLGRDYSALIDDALAGTSGVQCFSASPVDNAVQRLAQGQIGAIYTGRMEYGPRALGARSILANPANRGTHDLLNQRLDRSEFMPFAPVIAMERASEVFDVNSVNARACRYMTIACDVRPAWRERISAVVHVDGSARPQTIAREDNPLYYDIVTGFERATALPVLVNTSFNVHEEPIVNSPVECVKALVDKRVDFVVTDRALYTLS